MPVSKQARSRQERQKARVAAASRERAARKRKRQRIAMTAVALVAILGIVIIAVATGNDSSKKVTVPPATSGSTAVAPTTTTPPSTDSSAPLSVKGKPCVGLKDTFGKGELTFTVPAGPAPTTLVKNDIKVGTGATATATSTVTASYSGVACSTGKIFDTSVRDKQDFTASLSSGVIKGWQQGIPGMKVGGIRVLGVPSDLAYGDTQQGPLIAPGEALWFAIQLKKIS